jgi:putative transposase
LIEKANEGLSLSRQCQVLHVSRSTYYYEPVNTREELDLCDLKLIIEVLSLIPFYGYRKISLELISRFPHMTRKRVRRLMKRFGLRAIYAKRNLSKARKDHLKYPYLLGGKVIRHPNQVWASDITYINVGGSFVYLVAILDLYSRNVLAWRISNTLDSGFCVDALEEALTEFGVPAIFNTDQGSQFTSEAFTSVLDKNNIRISMDSKGRALDNIYVERLWRSLKYEDIYLKSYESVNELKEGVKRYFEFYNQERFHQSHGYLTPDQMHESFCSEKSIEKAA